MQIQINAHALNASVILKQIGIEKLICKPYECILHLNEMAKQ